MQARALHWRRFFPQSAATACRVDRLCKQNDSQRRVRIQLVRQRAQSQVHSSKKFAWRARAQRMSHTLGFDSTMCPTRKRHNLPEAKNLACTEHLVQRARH
eukprot:2468897-Amphidinium_carterae.2